MTATELVVELAKRTLAGVPDTKTWKKAGHRVTYDEYSKVCAAYNNIIKSCRANMLAKEKK